MSDDPNSLVRPGTIERAKVMQAMELLGIDVHITAKVMIGPSSITVQQNLTLPRGGHATLTYTMEIRGSKS